ncbi:MAG TPA: GNAT family N-acetyltransferase [Pseudonocardiaceae bacterium]
MDLLFRMAVKEDAGEVTALVRRAYRGPESRQGWTTEADLLDDERIDPAHVADKITRPGSLILLAEDPDGSLVACCELARRDDAVAYFGMFAVEPTRQGGGIGRVMLDQAAMLVRRQWGSTRMEMTVIAQRRDIIAWYERRGFHKTGEHRPFPFGDLINGTALRDDLYFEVLVTDLVSATP